MSLYIDVRVNNTVVATARVGNIGGPEEASEYIGSAWTAAGNRREVVDDIAISGHDRQSSVWLLVAKIALGLARKQHNDAGRIA